jgi:hypothetical protein
MSHALYTGLSVVAFLCSLSSAAEFWVDQRHKEASDANPGSREKPWLTVGKAAATLVAGDTVVVRKGVYREYIAPKGSGTKDKPITYKAEGSGVVLSGADAVTGWTRHKEDIWVAEAGWEPDRLFLDGTPLVKAREPNTGWWLAEGGDTHTLVDSKHLTEADGYWVGSTVFFWDVDVTTQGWRKVTAFDAKTHTLTLDKPIYRERVVEAGKDRYFIENKLTLLDRPGEWAVEPAEKGFRICVWPPDGDDPNAHLIEAPRRGRFVVEYANRSHLRFDGFEVRHGAGHGIGSWSPTAEGIAITNCYVHHNLGNGLYPHCTNNAVLKGNLVTANSNGITCAMDTGLVIEANEIGWNEFDGLVVGGKSRDVVIRRNYIHDHNLWGHPDNIQFHGGLTGVTIEENVILNGGQAIMMEQCDQGVIRGNVIAGSEAVAVIHGHGNVKDFQVVGNTIAFTGYGTLSFTGKDYEVRGNILCPGGDAAAIGVGSTEGFKSDYNLLYKVPGMKGCFAAFGRNWPGDFAGYQKVSGQDAHSISADPQFLNAPKYCIQIEDRRLTECTAEKILLRGSTGIFAPGDQVEVLFDGVVRTVKSVGSDHIVIDPPLAEAPQKGGLVLNWKEKTSFALDLRVSPTSPARKAGEGGADLGAGLDIQAFAKGDVDADGKPAIRRAHP